MLFPQSIPWPGPGHPGFYEAQRPPGKRAMAATAGGRDGRVAEGAGLLNRYTVKSRIGGSNPPLSATLISLGFVRFPAWWQHPVATNLPVCKAVIRG